MSTTPDAVTRLIIESEVRRLLAQYAHNLDFGDVEANGELLADAQFTVVDQSITGKDNIANFLRTNLQYHSDKTPRTWHSVSNILIEVQSATEARSVCYFTVHQQTDGLPLQPIVTGRYIDTFALRDGKWRFASRAVDPHLFGDISHHVASAAAPAAA
ncbi:SnoaL-like protein [Ancylobacter aquaticus]|uniref:SnoaL-like protein n=1 Tax=Ancylobacter aquaticus TaxID=100 RepID=A0A4R1HDI6_ANCAQ|nr:nuclear transport factor 2 family protein [Ancylobacter aquaticus]TCK19598.1 SnoaL-like protein [Ancylobacter aquaticus]